MLGLKIGKYLMLASIVSSTGLVSSVATVEASEVNTKTEDVQKVEVGENLGYYQMREDGTVIRIDDPSSTEAFDPASLQKELLADYTISAVETAEWAASMQKLADSDLVPWLTGAIGAYVGGSAGAVIGDLVGIIVKNRALRQEVINAAAKGSRLRVLIYDETPHTSYSITVQLIAVP